MIHQEEIDAVEQRQLVLFMQRQGPAPEWFKIFALADKANAPVWEVERVLAARDPSMVCASKREWLKRALIVILAEGEIATADARLRLMREARRRIIE